MQFLDKVKKTEFLGSEFLAWIWFRSETERGVFEMADERKAEVWIAGKITLQSDNEQGPDTITCSGGSPDMREARFALAEGKKITQATMKLTIGDNRWSFTIDSTWLNFRACKTPGVVQDKGEDPEGLFYEKAFLIEEAVSALDEIYSSFIRLRFSPDWDEEELPSLLRWIDEGRQRNPPPPIHPLE
jgi:recombination associated protein RdgC